MTSTKTSKRLKMISTPFCASVLLITKGDRPQDKNFGKILHLSNFFELKRRVYIHLAYKHSEPESVRYSVSISYFTKAVQNVNKVCGYAREWTSYLSSRCHVEKYSEVRV